MASPSGEMPFLDHLEELRLRILKSAGALVAGMLVGLWLVERFQLIVLLKKPIEPYLPAGGKLIVLGPTEPVMIVLKLGFTVGLVLASPVIIYQLWAFLSPALYAKERKALVPGLLIGLLLFMVGGVLGYLYVVPQTLRVLFSFQSEALAPFITYDKYFSFLLQVVLALGISFELPLVIILLSIFGVLTPASLSRFRRFAIVLACIAGAILSPGADVISMVMMTIPLIFLYEVGYAGSVVIHRRRKRRAMNTTTALGLVALMLGASSMEANAQVPVDTTRPRVRLDSLRPGKRLTDSTRTPSQLDTATAARLGLPTGPTRQFPTSDSIIDELLARPGYQSVRYRADSATLFAAEKRIELKGAGLTQRGSSIMEADSAITYDDDDCIMVARGSPRLFDGASVVISHEISYNHCTRRAVIADALTNFQEGSTTWFLRGTLAQDSSSSRLYAAKGEITSCDLPVPHYHFSAREVKWISKTVLVARPAVLYVRDVPILWLPFIFQDARPGRRSGILIPQFGINDIVRPNTGYNRQITNIGYYWAPNEYFDLTARLDWYSNRYTQYGIEGQYRWLNRFVTGNLGYSRTSENTGARTTNIRWNHRQNFNLNTSLNLDFNYVSNGNVLRRNAIDPLISTQEIRSSVNFSKRFAWGAFNLGGRRAQSLSNQSVTQTIPSLSISPKPLDLSRNITWSPALSFSRDQVLNSPLPILLVADGLGGLDTVRTTGDTRTTAFSLDTPLRVGGFNWRNSVRVSDRLEEGRETITFREENPNTPGIPNDSITVSRTAAGDFQTGFDWDTGINLPTLFRSTFKIQPAVGVDNIVTGSPLAIRNRATGGDYVFQGKRFSLSMSAAPTLFGFFPGIGPIGRIRHSISPIFSWTYRPAADVPLEYARAIAQPGRPLVLRSDPNQVASIGLSQTFEGKARRAAGDTTDDANLRKYRILSISTSGLSYDFEQAKKPGRTGWTTSSLSNTFQSDLLPGFSLNMTHDLWRGPVGFDTTKFDPFLSSMNASFGLSVNTFRSLLSIFGLYHRKESSGTAAQPGQQPAGYQADLGRRRSASFYNTDQYQATRMGQGFTANLNFSLSRTRPTPLDSIADPEARQSLGISTSFSPTPLWSLDWSAQYNITDRKFESHVLRLTRDLHEWKASFNFTRNANGNFQFFFSIFLSDLPEVKFDYDQTTIER